MSLFEQLPNFKKIVLFVFAIFLLGNYGAHSIMIKDSKEDKMSSAAGFSTFMDVVIGISFISTVYIFHSRELLN